MSGKSMWGSSKLDDVDVLRYSIFWCYGITGISRYGILGHIFARDLSI